MTRTPLISGNWKMYLNHFVAIQTVQKLHYVLLKEAYESVIPLGRPQTPEDIGKMAAFLASEDSRNVTGQCIHVDGGVILRD